MATPTSACFSAGASLTPSPVMDTTCPDGLHGADKAQLVLGTRAGKDIDAAALGLKSIIIDFFDLRARDIDLPPPRCRASWRYWLP